MTNLAAPNAHMSKPKIQMQLMNDRFFFSGANSSVILVV